MNELIQYKLGKLKITEQCRDLLNRLLVFDYKKRMDKASFFSHPFVKVTSEEYKEELIMKLEKSVLTQVSTAESMEETDSPVSSPESETIFYSSHK
jgi:uncharacterized membrane protein YheB (UPF0754 family)